MPECPNCEKFFKGRACRTCGWTAEKTPALGEGKRWVWKTECEWLTDGRRCLIRPSATLDGGRQYCAWHHAVSLMGTPRAADHYPSYGAYVEDFRTRGHCIMETHYPTRVTFSWICGEAVSAKPEPCGAAACTIRIQQQATMPAPRLSSGEHKAAAALVQRVLGGELTIDQAYEELPFRPDGAPPCAPAA